MSALPLEIRLKKRPPQLEQKTPRDAIKPAAYCVIPGWVLMHPVARQGHTLLVLAAIASHANKSGFARPSQARIAEMLSMPQQSVSRCIKRLVKAGILTIPYSRPAANGWRQNVYQVNFKGEDPPDFRTAQSISQSEPPPKLSTDLSTDAYKKLTASSTSDSDVLVDDHCLKNKQLPQPLTLAVTNNEFHQYISKPLHQYIRADVQEDEHIYNPPFPPLKSEDILKCWNAAWKVHKREAMITEADQATARELEARGVTLRDVQGALADHALERHQARRPLADRLRTAVADLLAGSGA